MGVENRGQIALNQLKIYNLFFVGRGPSTSLLTREDCDSRIKATVPFIIGRGYSPRSGANWGSRSGRTREAVVLSTPQLGSQPNQFTYSPHSWANKRFHFIIRPAADYVTRHLIGQLWLTNRHHVYINRSRRLHFSRTH